MVSIRRWCLYLSLGVYMCRTWYQLPNHVINRHFDSTLYSIHTHFNTLKKKALEKHCEKGEIAHFEQFRLFHNAFYAICILKSFTSLISVVVCRFFEFRAVSKWCIKEWVYQQMAVCKSFSICFEHAKGEIA